jgi:hypothetical protein
VALYAIHDDLEAALRELDRVPANPRKARRLAWKAHDRLERVIIAEQAKRAYDRLKRVIITEQAKREARA